LFINQQFNEVQLMSVLHRVT